MSVDAVAAVQGRRSTVPRALRRVLGAVVGAFSIAILVAYVVVWSADGWIAADFEAAFRTAADDILAGRNPYTTDLVVLDGGAAYVYPPLTALVSVVFAPLSVELASGLVTVGLIALVVGALLLLDVRDWRCHAIVLAWPATLSGLQTGNVSIPLLFAAALAWRYRERAGSAIALGVSFAVKPLVWPLLPWLWLRGSRRHAVTAVAIGAAVVVGSWAAIGFAGIVEYPEIVRDITRLQETEAYTVFALGLSLGAPEAVARALGVALALGLLAGSMHRARHGADAQAFALGVAATLALAPVVWLHYFVLLAAAIGVARSRLAAAWFAPLAMWGVGPTFVGPTRDVVFVLVAATAAIALAIGARAPERQADAGARGAPVEA